MNNNVRERPVSRIVEVAIAVLGSVMASAAVTYFMLPVTLAHVQEHLAAIDAGLARHDVEIRILSGNATDIASLKARQDGDDTFRREINQRLTNIEQTQNQILAAVRTR